jgi:hypothetical protein
VASGPRSRRPKTSPAAINLDVVDCCAYSTDGALEAFPRDRRAGGPAQLLPSDQVVGLSATDRLRQTVVRGCSDRADNCSLSFALNKQSLRRRRQDPLRRLAAG